MINDKEITREITEEHSQEATFELMCQFLVYQCFSSSDIPFPRLPQTFMRAIGRNNTEICLPNPS